MFEPYNASDLAEKIERLYGMPQEEQKQYGILGRRYIRENRRVEVLVDRMVKVLFE